jgi:hypothetical protein
MPELSMRRVRPPARPSLPAEIFFVTEWGSQTLLYLKIDHPGVFRGFPASRMPYITTNGIRHSILIFAWAGMAGDRGSV